MTLPARLLALVRHHLRRSDRARCRELVGQRAASVTVLSSGRTRSAVERRRRAQKRTGAVVAARSVTTSNPYTSVGLTNAIADVFCHVHQSHGPDVSNEIVLTDVADRIMQVLVDAGHSRERFCEVASMSGLPVGDPDAPAALPARPQSVGLTDQQATWINDLRTLTDFLEAHPALIPNLGLSILRPVQDAEEMRAVTRGTGRWTKHAIGDWFNLEQQVGVHTVSVFAARGNVCERRVVGTKTVEVPDPEVMKGVPLVTVEEDVIEWVCPDSLLAETRS